MFNAKTIILAKALRPDLNFASPGAEELIWLKIASRYASSNPVRNATIENGIAYFDGVVASQPLVSLKLNIPVTQTGSGTPSPDNVRDFISFSGVNISRTGVNVWDEEWEVGGLTWATGLPIGATDRFRSKNFSAVTPSTNYYAKTSGLSELVVFAYDKNKEFISYERDIYNRIFTTPSNARFIKIVSLDTSTTYNHDISINYPSTDTEYHPYTGNTYQITFGQTVYSAILDVLTGKLSITHAYQVYNGSEDWRISSTGNNYFLEIGMNYMVADTIIANEFENPHHVPTVNYIGIYNSARFIQLRPSTEELDVQAWKTWLNSNNLKVVYELATPIEIDLTPTVINTLIGDNVIFADVANVTECKYTRK